MQAQRRTLIAVSLCGVVLWAIYLQTREGNEFKWPAGCASGWEFQRPCFCHYEASNNYCGMTIRLYEEMLAWTVQFGGCGVLTLASLAGPKWESLRFLAILLLILGPLLCLTTLFFHHEFDTFSYYVGDNHGLLYGLFSLGLDMMRFIIVVLLRPWSAYRAWCGQCEEPPRSSLPLLLPVGACILAILATYFVRMQPWPITMCVSLENSDGDHQRDMCSSLHWAEGEKVSLWTLRFIACLALLLLRCPLLSLGFLTVTAVLTVDRWSTPSYLAGAAQRWPEVPALFSPVVLVAQLGVAVAVLLAVGYERGLPTWTTGRGPRGRRTNELRPV
mmetsp:Transcript_5599/g.13612  ORF Transcript_5599/g.13612 Transcript_5599/m.13612 type:complete len:331 (+) Transcript_5599:2-994(+)